MEKIYKILIIIAIPLLIVIFGFCFWFWVTFFDGTESLKFYSQGININKVYSNVNGPAVWFRHDVEQRLQKHIDIPKNYNFYFTEEKNAGEFEISRSYTLHMEWIDENYFFHRIIAKTKGSVDSINFMRIDIYKQGVNSPLTFKDYVPSVYFYQSGYEYEENKYSTKEPNFVDEVRAQIKLVIKNPELTLAEMNLPVIEIVRKPLEMEDKETIIGVRVLSKDKGGKFVHEYDYNGDGYVDEVKVSQTISGSAIELAERLGLRHTVEYNRWKILPDDKYEYFSRDSGVITRFVFDNQNFEGIFRSGAITVEINSETEEMMIRFFPFT